MLHFEVRQYCGAGLKVAEGRRHAIVHAVSDLRVGKDVGLTGVQTCEGELRDLVGSDIHVAASGANYVLQNKPHVDLQCTGLWTGRSVYVLKTLRNKGF